MIRSFVKPIGAVAIVAGLVPAVTAACGGPFLTVGVPAHPALAAHAMPKRIEVATQIDLRDNYFANPQGEKNPTIRVSAGKTIGLHFHNEGSITHEFVIGRKLKADGKDYEEVLTEKVPADVFAYFGTERIEIGGAEFGEIEMDKGVRDIWLRLTIPETLRGEWELGCFVPGHYEAGMHAKLIVE